jgi:hypothetical protein
MCPHLVVVVPERLDEKRMMAVKVQLAASDDVGFDGSHVTEVIENVEAIIGTAAKSVYVLKVNAECVIRFTIDEFWAPVRIHL